MKRKTRSLLAFGMAVLTAAPAIYGAELWRSGRPLVSLEDLLPVSPAFPVAWPTGDLEVSNLNWRVSEEDSALVPGFASRAQTALTRTWAGDAKDGAPEIAVGIYRYGNPILAAAQSWLSRPERFYSDHCLNFTSAGRSEDRYPRSWTPSKFADAELAACGIGNPGSCAFWIYRARYGQYILNVEFWAPNRGMSSSAFLEVVREVDTHLIERLGVAEERR